MRLALRLAALLVVASPLAAQSNLERVVNGALTPSHDFDLIHQRIEVSGFDWDSSAFDGVVTTTVVSRRPGLEAVVLDMHRQLEARAVIGPGGSALRFERPGDSIVVRPARPAGFGDTVRFTVRYRGRIAQGLGLYFFDDEPGRPRRHRQVYSGGGTDGNPRWIPTYGPPHDKATWDLIATVPSRFTVVSNGRLVSDRVGRGIRTTHWSQDRPASTYLISLVVAPLVRLRDRWREVPVDYYVYPEDSALARPLFGVTPDMMETFARLTGVRYPWHKYAQTTVADFIGGMENVSATTLVDWLPDARAYRDRPWYRYALIPHELAHQWFGNLVTAENWANYWLNEGFAQFMPGQYWAAKYGPQAADDYDFEQYQQFMARDARRRMPLATYNSNNVYFKGALVLRMLEKHLGPERFWAAVNRYLTRHSGRTATSDDLRQAVLDATGESLGWFWSQWIYQAGYPEFAVSAAWDSAAGSVTLQVRQTQQDTATADSTGLRFVTPLVFRAPVEVRVGTARGDVVRSVVIERREQKVRIGGVTGPPTMVVFDDDNAVVKTLEFEQPTPWLATLLERHPDLWNRSWAVGQLARRTADSLAAAALASAARRADHPLTRSQAVAALARFPVSAARPAIDAALADTSARVREAAVAALAGAGGRGGGAAVAALAGAGGPGAADSAARLWREDPSYEVRAAALAAFARLAPERARDAVAEGLGTPSYREAIRNAAITAALERPDSVLIAALERNAGAQELPVLALAALAQRGDASARAALARLTEDRRAWVREWARRAVREVGVAGSR